MVNLSSLLVVVGIVAILGFIAWIVGRAPVIEEEFKSIIKWGLIVLAGIVVIVWVLGALHIGTPIRIG